MRYFIWAVLGLVAVVATGMMTGCGPNAGPLEIFSFKYQMSTPTGPNSYAVHRSSMGSCSPGYNDRMRLDQVADVIQGQQVGFASIVECADQFTLNVRQSRADGSDIKFKVREGSANDSKFVEVNANGAALPGNTAGITGVFIQPAQEMVINGVKSTGGFAEFFLGSNGAVFRCESSAGDNPWSAHISNPATATFFEFRLTSLAADSSSGSGDFQCLARNRTDPNDTRLLIVTEGTFGLQTH